MVMHVVDASKLKENQTYLFPFHSVRITGHLEAQGVRIVCPGTLYFEATGAKECSAQIQTQVLHYQSRPRSVGWWYGDGGNVNALAYHTLELDEVPPQTFQFVCPSHAKYYAVPGLVSNFEVIPKEQFDDIRLADPVTAASLERLEVTIQGGRIITEVHPSSVDSSKEITINPDDYTYNPLKVQAQPSVDQPVPGFTPALLAAAEAVAAAEEGKKITAKQEKAAAAGKGWLAGWGL